MRATITAALFLVGFVLALFFIYPPVFTFIKGLFDNSDLGTIAGLAVCFLITGPIFWAAALLGFVATGFAATFDEDARLKKRNRQRYNRR